MEEYENNLFSFGGRADKKSKLMVYIRSWIPKHTNQNTIMLSTKSTDMGPKPLVWPK
jgi:hypothetical protein